MITIKDISTRELAKAFKNRHNFYAYYDEDDKDDLYTFSRRTTGDVVETISVTQAELRRELATREHVPNKHQAAMIRKVMAKNKCSKEEVFSKFAAQLFPKNRQQVTKEFYKTVVRYYGKGIASKKYVIK